MSADERERAAHGVPVPSPERMQAWQEWKDDYLNACIDGWVEQGATRDQLYESAAVVVSDLMAVDALPWMPLARAQMQRASVVMAGETLTGEAQTQYINALRTAETATRVERTLSMAYVLGVSVQQAAGMRDKAEAHSGREADTKGKTSLYRHLDASGVLLYVGIANEPDKRSEQHRHTARWWPFVAATEVEWHASRRDAEAAERLAIVSERPVFNSAHNKANRDAAVDYLFSALDRSVAPA